MNSHSSSTFRTLLVAALATVALASQTRHYGSSNLGGAGLGVGGLGLDAGVGAGLGLGGVGAGLGLGGVGAGLGLGGFGVGPGISGVQVGGGVGVGGLGGGYVSSGSCRYWCRTPQGQAYCCEDGNEVASLPTVKPGQCPPVRPQCPPTRLGFRPPQQCSNDSRCPGVEKCCFDTCLQHHTCKAPIYIYGYTPVGKNYFTSVCSTTPARLPSPSMDRHLLTKTTSHLSAVPHLQFSHLHIWRTTFTRLPSQYIYKNLLKNTFTPVQYYTWSVPISIHIHP